MKARQSSTETKQSVYVQMLEKQELLLIQYDYDYWGRNQNNFEKLRMLQAFYSGVRTEIKVEKQAYGLCKLLPWVNREQFAEVEKLAKLII